MTDIATFDETKAGAFAEKMIGILNGSSLALQTSIGHQTGLFDAMSSMAPSTSVEIADAAKLNERYVREWLGAMVTGGVVEYDPDGKTYRLPPEHAAFTTRAAGPNNLANMMQFIALLGEVEQPVIECFRNGGGVPYSSYPRFSKLMAEDSAAVHDAALIDGILPMVDGIVEKLEAGIDVADIGCGRGHAINLMAKAFPNSRFTGFDFSEEGVEAGAAEAKALGLSNATFAARDVSDLGLSDALDFVTAFDAIHDQAKPAEVLAGIAKALRPDGTFLMVDIRASSHLHENIDHPLGPFLYTASTMHCMTVSLALDGAGLGTAWGEQIARSMLADAGFTSVDVKNIEEDIANSYYIARKA
jgi:ubiquinone/menaquinone biosynthesis C-methylase UbiE